MHHSSYLFFTGPALSGPKKTLFMPNSGHFHFKNLVNSIIIHLPCQGNLLSYFYYKCHKKSVTNIQSIYHNKMHISRQRLLLSTQTIKPVTQVRIATWGLLASPHQTLLLKEEDALVFNLPLFQSRDCSREPLPLNKATPSSRRVLKSKESV
jgi:hypothetical protein